MKLTKLIAVLLIGCIASTAAFSQETASTNGVKDERTKTYAFTNATLVRDGGNQVSNATLVIRKGRIIAAGTGVNIPADATVIDCTGKWLYPSFIDIYSDYGLPVAARPAQANFFGAAQLTSNLKGALNWNQAIHSEFNAAEVFAGDEAKAKPLREAGFGMVQTHRKDGIARGTGLTVDLSDRKENLTIIRERSSNNFSFNKGTSTQSYPGSLMGSIALLRQTYLDAQWYKGRPATEGVNLSLDAWTRNMSLPQIFEAGDKWMDLRADRIGDEFGVQYIIKAGQNEYQRIPEMKASGASFILPLNFPETYNAEDVNEMRFVSLADLKQWEMAPMNAGAFEKAGINFCLTTADLRDVKSFMTNLRKSIQYGLSESAALNALTKNPAQLLGLYNDAGSLDAGKLANFLITDGPLFAEKTAVLQNWIQGEKYLVKEAIGAESRGKYSLVINAPQGVKTFPLEVSDEKTAKIMGTDTVTVKFAADGKFVKLSFAETKKGNKNYWLSGTVSGKNWKGLGTDSLGNQFSWSAMYTAAIPPAADSAKKKDSITMASLTYPNGAYGWRTMPVAENILIKNATVWTSEADAVLLNTDVLVQNGKISSVGKNLSAGNARTVDGTGKYLTAGIIDEHSHIAAASINEGGQSVTSEVRVGDNMEPEDIDIYRQLAGGVTTSHILHGSANTIGGQTQLMKHRWGVNDTMIKFRGADPFIKFALGENVKRTPAQQNTRYPDTRMGVEEVLNDAFTRAEAYRSARRSGTNVRRDLELDALAEILDKKRFITCHSYVQSEITSILRICEKFNFRLNTLTHILEGYKVADKIKAHGANTSTFSDWWAYKQEVQDAIAYNAALMNGMGINTAINSDDAEMARRLNQEAAKTVKYGGVSEQEAWKMVTINPAKMLHVDNQIGSIKVGKDADLVLWNENPLSIYAKPEVSMVDGIVYYTAARDMQFREENARERNRIIQKLLNEKKDGASTATPRASMRRVNECEEHGGNHGLLDEIVIE